MKNILIAVSALIVASGCGTTTGTQIINTNTSDAAGNLTPLEVKSEVTQMSALIPASTEPGEVVENTPSGQIDWSDNTIRATGQGVVDMNNPNTAQARLMAERAAVVTAQRNLLETVKGVTINSDTRVENFITDYDIIYSRVDGVVKNASQVGPARYDETSGVVEVELEMKIYSQDGLSAAISAALASPEEALPMSDKTRDFLTQYSALVFDGSGAGLQPSMYPKIYDSNGNLLLDTSVYAHYLGSDIQSGIQFISDLDRILGNSQFSQEPLVVQVRQVTGAMNTDIVLGVRESEALGWLKAGLPFLTAAGKFLIGIL
ncbi:hypothetical protein CSA37_08600 [Candidatus Fermentibacteria bacterium]|nr:MAG: hypothetical protein CSA37_08600 [Candidatus Fermentibacteria bacterium]